MNTEKKLEIIRDAIKCYPDFPKPGIIFRDIFSILQQIEPFEALCEVLLQKCRDVQPPIQCIAALESRGFLFGPLLALQLKIPFVPIRKKGKLPGKVKCVTYKLEYGEDTVEIQNESIKNGQKVLIIDDLLATGGTLAASCELIKKVGGEVAQCIVIMELVELEGQKKISAPVHSLIKL